MTPVFHTTDTPLARGTTLIEASAGTGKTYSITAIFLRLLLEHGLNVSEILVTTYTEAATGELRERIRSRLTSAFAGFETSSSEDPLVQGLLTRINRTTAIPILERSIREFDQAAIYTIHGFCQRMLRDRALESGLPFDAELVADQNPLLQEIVDDFWRMEFGTPNLLLGSACTQAKITRQSLLQLLKQFVNRPLMVVIPEYSSGALAAAKTELATIYDSLCTQWKQESSRIRQALTGPPKWAKGNRGMIGHPETLNVWLDSLSRCLEDAGGAVDDFTVLNKLCSSHLAKACLKSSVEPRHPFFDACERYKQICEDFAGVANASFLGWASQELRKRKDARNVLSFDDLLTRLHDSLRGDGGMALRDAIRSRFRAALIDEFQDTDPTQEAIFRIVFGRGDTYLYLIGDPKQAIYGFRGADIFSYLRAAANAKHRYTLRTNRRSASRLVHAVNHLFSRATAPFVFSEISFLEVEASGQRDGFALTRSDKSAAPLKISIFEADTAVSSTTANRNLPSLTAASISNLLGGDAKLGTRSVQPSDISVLVAQHWQARAIQEALRNFDIPSVLLSDESVWHTNTAFEMHLLLAAVAEPGREDKVRAAFATEIMGGTVTALNRMISSAADWEAALSRFGRYHERWLNFGFIQMFRSLVLGEHVRARLLRLPDGDRQLTNVMHIAELLHRESLERNLSPAALTRWLESQRVSEGSTSEDAILRLERDDDAVQVITMHRSKGLEFNIVFCPFAWGKPASREKDGPIVFHDPSNEHRLTLDLGSDAFDEHRQLLATERLAEESRLLYVALTRAIHECHFVWGRFSACPVSAAALILHQPSAATDVVTDLRDRMLALTPTEFRSDLDALESTSNGCIAVSYEDDGPGVPYSNSSAPTPEKHSPRAFRHRIDRSWGVSSFTSLVSGANPEVRDRDPVANPLAIDDDPNLNSIHALPGGTGSGLCLHALLEAIDFTNPDGFGQLVQQKLKDHSLDPELWSSHVTRAIEQTVAVENPAGFRLSDLGPRARLSEVEFHLPVSRLNRQELALIMDDIGALEFQDRKGWLKGFIDLVCEHQGRYYVVDWKSNRLGANSAAYSADAIARTMADYHYHLQASLYLVALHRYLKPRVPGYEYDRHCGGALYYFVRGCDANTAGSGVHSFRPPAEKIESLSKWLHDEN